MALYVGLDASTQSLSAIAIEVGAASRRVVFDDSIPYDSTFPEYQTRNGVLRAGDPRVATAPPLMWAAALDAMMAKLAAAIDVTEIAAISGSAQQHGSVYLNAKAADVLAGLDAAAPLVDQLSSIFSRADAPVWMDASTADECGDIALAVGGNAALAASTGSRAFERFTAAQIRRFYKTHRAAYESTARIHLVSSFHASLLTGAHAPVDAADASGMNLMGLATRQWWPPAIEATAPNLTSKLPPIVRSSQSIGTVAPYWRDKYGFPEARVIAWSGDNPSSAIGTGLVAVNAATVSLGTSDTVFGLMPSPAADPDGTGHVFCDPTGGFMGLTCFQNGSLARKEVRDAFGLTWEAFSQVLRDTPPGNDGGLLLPWFGPEITPPVFAPGVRRFRLAEDDAARNVRGVIEGQVMAMRRHTGWMGVAFDRIHATGGGAGNRALLQVIADVFGAAVHQLRVGNSAALGAALRAAHGDDLAPGVHVEWPDIVRGFVDPVATLQPDPSTRPIYDALIADYARFEAESLTTQPAYGDEAYRSPES